MDCLFCKIIAGDIPATSVYQDDKIFVFDDIHPQAPHHKLLVPKKHIATINDLTPDDNELVGYLVTTAKDLAKKLNMADDGYRLVFNCNSGGGQMVYHIHLHLLGGRQMLWPPG